MDGVDRCFEDERVTGEKQNIQGAEPKLPLEAKLNVIDWCTQAAAAALGFMQYYRARDPHGRRDVWLRRTPTRNRNAAWRLELTATMNGPFPVKRRMVNGTIGEKETAGSPYDIPELDPQRSKTGEILDEGPKFRPCKPRKEHHVRGRAMPQGFAESSRI